MTRWLLLIGLGAAGCGAPSAPGSQSAQGGHTASAGQGTTHAGATHAGADATHAGAGGGEAAEPGSGGSSGAPGGGDVETCGLTALEALEVFSPSWDPLGYPPYAIDGCQVLYVAAEAAGGALYHVDLTSGARTLLDEPAQHPRRPTIAGDVMAWERDGQSGPSAVRVRTPAGERTFDASGEPRATLDAVVYTRFLGPGASDDTDVYLYRTAADEEQPIASGAGQQRFADVSVTHVALTDFAEDPRGYFDQAMAIADVVVIDRQTGAATARALPGKQAFPLLGTDGVLVYLEWGAVHPEPKFSQFFLKAGKLAEPAERDLNVKGQDPVSTDVAYVRPSLHGTRIDFVDRAGGVRLYSVDALGTAAPVAVADVTEAQLFGPASAARITLVAAPASAERSRLVAVAR